MLSVRTNTCVGICTYKCDFCIFVTYKLGTLTRSKIAHLESSNWASHTYFTCTLDFCEMAVEGAMCCERILMF